MARFAHASHDYPCPLQLAINLSGGRWRSLLIHHIGHGIDRFGALRRRIDGISERMLAQELRVLVEMGLVEKEIFPEMPPRTAYRLTADGRELMEAMEPLRRWGKRYRVRDG